MTDVSHKRAREMLEAWIDTEGNWTPTNRMMVNLWEAFPMYAYRVGHITDMLVAINQLELLEGREVYEAKVQKLLTKMCRDGVLRSRYEAPTKRGEPRRRFYEINF